jgi:hypothetical protein
MADRIEKLQASASERFGQMLIAVRRGCCWQKVYEHGANGIVTSGSINVLRDAVYRGADVKVRYRGQTGRLEWDWTRRFASVTVTVDHGNLGKDDTIVVSGVMTDIPDTDLNIVRLPGTENTPGGVGGGGGRSFAQPFALEWHIYNTSGQRQVVKFDAVTHQVVSDDTDQRAMSWYVRR